MYRAKIYPSTGYVKFLDDSWEYSQPAIRFWMIHENTKPDLFDWAINLIRNIQLQRSPHCCLA
jgi:hypothetical protein